VKSPRDGKEKQTAEQKEDGGFGAALKAKVALEALGNKPTVVELAAKYQLHPDQIHARKKRLLDGAAAVFSGGGGKEASREAEVTEFDARIGQLTVKPNFLSLREVQAMKRPSVWRWSIAAEPQRVQRLMRLMGLEALGPKPKTSRPAARHRI
jgi:transposase